MADKAKPLPTTPSGGLFTSGVVNPKGFAWAAFGAAYLGFIPVTSYLARTEAVQSLTVGLAGLVPGSMRVIPALSALYTFWTFSGSGALSVAGQSMARPDGLDNNHPRQHLHNLGGFPLRLRSAHYGLLENFAPWALAAALAQVLAPGDAEITALLGLHVAAKLLVFYPAYLLNIDTPRSLSHVTATASVLDVFWRLAVVA